MYLLYGSKLSLFTRKLEAALQFYGVPFEFRDKRQSPERMEIQTRAGTHQVPVLVTPENWPLADTTPIIDLLDHRYPARRLFPDGALGVLTHIVEDYLDEWTARVMVHYRWHYPESTLFASTLIGAGNEQHAEYFRTWGPRACRATGTETAFHQRAVEEEYCRLLDAAEQQLGETKFLLGDRPTAVDCMVLGGLRAHTLHDPDPRKVVLKYPRIVAWNETATTNWRGDGDWLAFPASTPFARFVLSEAAQHYQPFLCANALALHEGRKTFMIDSHGEPASFLCRPYPERARAMIRNRIAHRLDEGERCAVLRWLEELDLNHGFAPEACQRKAT